MTSNDKSSPAPPRSWSAQLSLQAAVKHGKTVLLACQHQGPLRIQKPFYPEADGRCHLVLLHPPGGMVLGDHLQLHVEVQNEGRLLLTTPSASKFYNTQGGEALQCQHFTFHAGAEAQLEWFPHETIVFNGANGRLCTEFYLDPKALLCTWDIVCLGRPASGETFNQGYFEQMSTVYVAAQPIWIDRIQFDAQHPMMQARRGMYNQPIFGTFLATMTLSRDETDSLLQGLLHCVEGPDTAWGITQRGPILCVRYWGISTRICRLGFEYLWQHLRPTLFNQPAIRPRIWNT